MKRILSILVLIVILCSLFAVSASAAGSGSISMGSASGNRGDTVTLRVNLNSNPGLVTMTIKVSYDTSVLQLTNVSNSGLLVGAQLNTSYGSPYTISWVDGVATANNTSTGNIATFTFKILDNAKIGDSTVTLQFVDSYDTDYNENSFSASSGKVTVNCNHSYSTWRDSGNGQHSRTCSICSEKESVNHTWNSGSVTKESTCNEKGVKTFTCTTCKATKTESIAKTTDHKYSNWTILNESVHSHTCTVCEKYESAEHIWDNGEITKKPTCSVEGTKTFHCTVCEAIKIESVAKTTDHKYGSWTKDSNSKHKHICSVCSKEETAYHTWNNGAVTKKATCKDEGVKTYTCTGCNANKTEAIAKTTNHTYDHNCDKDCNVCGAVRTVNQSYKTSWDKDQTSHWHECTLCKDKKDVSTHTPGAEATESKAQTCTTCGYVIKAALGHKHSYATTWTTNEDGHWYSCSGCENKNAYAAHIYENDCDKDCAVCGFTRQTEHNFSETWNTDEEMHWHTCTGCGLKQDQSRHEPGPEATAATAQTCTICNYEIVSASDAIAETVENGFIETEPTMQAADDTKQPTQVENNMDEDAQASETNKKSFLIGKIIIPIVLIAITIVVVVMDKKRKDC